MKDDYYIIYEADEEADDGSATVTWKERPPKDTPSKGRTDEPAYAKEGRERRRRAMEARERRRLERLAKKEEKQRLVEERRKQKEAEYQRRVREYEREKAIYDEQKWRQKHGDKPMPEQKKARKPKRTSSGVAPAAVWSLVIPGAVIEAASVLLFAFLYPEAWYTGATALQSALATTTYVAMGLGILLLIVGDLLSFGVRRASA